MVLENKSFYITISFFINQIFKEIIIAFLLNVKFISFFLYYFFNSKLFLICFLQFFFIKSCSNFYSIKVFYYICPRLSIFNLFNHKDFFKSIQSVTFCKIIFIFIYLYIHLFTWSPTS